MMIELNKPFVDYKPLELLSGEGCAYRQVYKALDNEGTEVFLTVYEIENMPDCLQADTIKEFDLVYNLKNELFPRHIGTGTTIYEGRLMTFQSTLFFDGITLRETVSKNALTEKDAVKIAYRLTIAIKELLYLTKGGGHFNICPDTVLLTKDADTYIPHVIGMDHASEACNGSPEFDTETLNHCCRTPESFLGKFSPTSDVYSMGMLLAYMLQGDYPYKINESMSKADILKAVKKSKPQLNVSDEMKSIITKAISKKAGNRYKDVEELGIALMDYMGMEKPQTFSCFSNEKREKKRMPDESTLADNQNRLSQLTMEPRTNVSMSVRHGEGFGAVAGMAELKRKLKRDFVDIVSNKELAKEYGIFPPNMLFFGPPGTGKTFICERLAEECGLGVCSLKPSDLASVYAHGVQIKLRQIFDQAAQVAAKNKKGCLLLIEEYDAIAGARSMADHNYENGEVAELLTQLNDCVQKNIYVIGTTNFLNRIDKAVIRKGRMDEVVFIGMPDVECRRQIFELELRKRPHEEDIDMELLSKLTDGYTSSDISYIVKESARNSFEASIQTEDKCAVKISQALLEDVISKTRPSVSPDEVRQYEMMRDEYIRKDGNERRRVGFLA